MNTLTAVILDQQIEARASLVQKMNQHFPEVSIIGSLSYCSEARNIICQNDPDLVFLDLARPKMTGLDFMKNYLCELGSDFVFTDEIDPFPEPSYQVHAQGYLQKPIRQEQFISLMYHILDRRALQQMGAKIDRLSQLLNKYLCPMIELPTMNGCEVVHVEEILYCEADNNYTFVFLVDKRKILVSKTLKVFEKLLNGFSFLRVHKKHIINLSKVRSYIKGDGGQLVLSDGTVINVARNRKESLMGVLRGHFNK